MFNTNPHERKFDKDDKGGLYLSLQKEVGFSQSQLDKYSLLRKEQFQNLKPLFDEVKKSKEDFYSLVPSVNPPDSLVQSKANIINQNQNIVDVNMFTYFRKVRNLCTDGQLEKFDSVFRKSVMSRMTGRPGKSKRSQ
ncbi:MAG: hypothetical protein ABI266_03495 [Ginsengibacter sp.]